MGKRQSLENQYDRTGVALIIYCFAPVDVGVVRAGFFSRPFDWFDWKILN